MSNTSFPFYSFLPWARRGIASEINETEDFGTPGSTPALERAEVSINVNIQANGQNAPGSPLTVNLQIIGPGDITGINSNVVVRTEPRNWITNFEPHSFPFIEFYEEDFPWRYSPAKATSGQKLRPWLTLVVLKDDEFTRQQASEGKPLNSFTLVTSPWPLPEHDDTWAWAHVQANEGIDPDNDGDVAESLATLNTRLDQEPDIAISRILCPRRLEENTAYTAFLIPTYETGRLAGLGEPVPQTLEAQKAAWDIGTSANGTTARPGEFPIYYEWYFRTGATGDFEYLIRQLKPVTLSTQVGRRKMDVTSPGYGLSFTDGAGNSAGTMQLEGALSSAGPARPPFPYTPDTAQFQDNLRKFVNLAEDMIDPALLAYWTNTVAVPGNLQADPIIAPPLYGRWHALRKRVYLNSTGWVDELNLDPRNRVAAALGGDYVRNNQEWLMDMAWKQVGHVIEMNKAVNWGQLAQEANTALFRKNIAPQPDDQLLPITSATHARVKNISTSVSVRQAALASRLPAGADSGAFRKVQRPNGPLMKRVDPSGQAFTNTLTRLAQGTLDPAPVQAPPTAARFDASELNAAVSDSQTVNPNAVLFSIVSPNVLPAVANVNEAASFQDMLGDYTGVFMPSNWSPPASSPALNTTDVAQDTLDTLLPSGSFPQAFYSSKQFWQNATVQPPPDPWRLLPAMGAPSFHIAMYEALKELGLDFFLPNLHLIPQNSVSILKTNRKFIESFMVGANYEMGRELLWREYPTDQRGTYFRHFWEDGDNPNTEIQVRDITDINTWDPADPNSELGEHDARTNSNATSNIVLTIRGDFLKKFPTVAIYAQRAKWQTNSGGNPIYTLPRVIDYSVAKKLPIFGGKVDPDITLIGFDLTETQAKGAPQGDPGWFIVFAERPGELRFGLDVNPDPNSSPPPPGNWQGLMWDHLTTTTNGYMTLAYTTPTSFDKKLPPVLPNPPAGWPSQITIPDVNWAEDAAAMAMILYQNPVMVAFHASEMIS